MARTSARIKMAAEAQRTKFGGDATDKTSTKRANASRVTSETTKSTRPVRKVAAKTASREAIEIHDDDDTIEIDQDTSDATAEDSEGDSDEDEISAYERQRLANIARNMQLMAEIGLADLTSDAKARRIALTNQREESRKRRKEEIDALPRRQSRRVLGQVAEFSQAHIPAVVAPSNDEKDGNSDEDEEAASWESVASDAKHLGAFYDGLSSASPAVKSSSDDAKYSLDARDVVRVVPSRIYSIAFHRAISASSTLLAGIADIEGNFALWTPPVDRSSDAESGLTSFRLHKRAISALLFQDTALLSACMGGAVKRLDLGATNPSSASVVMELDAAITSFYVNSALSCMFLSCDDGRVVQADLRQDSKKQAQTHALHAKKVNTVHGHPTDPHVFVTASLDRSVKLWDVRTLKAPIAEMEHGKSVNCAYFAPDGRNVVSVCLDNFIYLHDTSSLVATLPSPRKIKHDNHTGQWLTKFYAIWDPKKLTDCEFVIGGNKRPRRVEIYGTTSPKPRQSLTDDLFNSVHSLNVFHPVLPIILGGNSSGRISMWRA